MAIDPAVAKVLAQLALKAVSEEETRKRVILIILAPVIGLLHRVCPHRNHRILR